MSVRCVMREIVERRLQRGVMWNGPCVNGFLHSTRWDIGPAPDPWTAGTIDEDDQPEGAACERCRTSVPWDDASLSRFGSSAAVWNTTDGKLGPGDMYWGHPLRDGGHHCSGNWTNCDGKHLYVILPNNLPWDIDSRASNCTLMEDFTHRCWIRSGEAPMITAGKDGHTCTAGAGSIQSGNYHGFLRDGCLTDS